MGECIDIERPEELLQYLRRTKRIEGNETVETRTLGGGVSNRAVLVKRLDGESWVIKQALPKLRVAVDWFSDVRRIEREAEGLRWLPQLAPPGTITPLIFEDPAQHLLAMAAVPEPHENWKQMLLRGDVRDDHVRQFATLLGVIHQSGHERRAEMQRVFRDRSFFESLRILPYYQYTADQVGGTAGDFLSRMIGRTRASRLTVVHGDFSPKNILVRDGRLILLDHEVIHFGEPAFDAGFAMTHLLSKAHHLCDHRQRFARAAAMFWQSYSAALGDCRAALGREREAVEHTLGCLLARVAGKSPLEYLSPEEKMKQQEAVLALMGSPPPTIDELIRGFVGRI